jgi:hypothetical protein
VFCTKCGAKNEDTARFCQSCGAALAATGVVPPPPPPPPAAIPVARSNGLLIGLLIACLVLAFSVAYMASQRHNAPASAPTSTADTVSTPTPQIETHLPNPDDVKAVKPVPSEDPVAEAQVVLENYLAVDLAHDGNAMAKFLGGQAAARFRPDVQGQGDAVTQSEKVSGHTVRDANTIAFSVRVKYLLLENNKTETDTEHYVLKRTEKGWKIFSTPAYPE